MKDKANKGFRGLYSNEKYPRDTMVAKLKINVAVNAFRNN